MQGLAFNLLILTNFHNLGIIIISSVVPSKHICPPIKCWATIYDAGSMLTKHRTNATMESNHD